jgi:hypothetical protein
MNNRKTVPFKDRIKSIKFVIFLLVYIPSVVFMPLHLITGVQFVSLMSLIVGIFTVAHEHSKRIENGNGNGGVEIEIDKPEGSEKPPQ